MVENFSSAILKRVFIKFANGWEMKFLLTSIFFEQLIALLSAQNGRIYDHIKKETGVIE